MRHSTGKPTKAEKKRMDAIKAGNCVCCHMLGLESFWPEIHHLLSGNKRRGHMFTVGLCSHHHRNTGFELYPHADELRKRLGPSLANGSKPFREAFGDDNALLEYQNRLLGDGFALLQRD